MDDVLVVGKNQHEHDERLIKVLERIRSAGVTLNAEKCELGKTSLKFLGHCIDKDGVRADPEKTAAICQMSPPRSVSDLRRFMGMVNRMGKFPPNNAEISKPLRELLSIKRAWLWGAEQDRAFNALKEELTKPTVLALYDPKAKSKVSAYASSFGLDAVLMQRQGESDWKPVAYASRSLTETEGRYAQIEKEALALTWSCEKFSDYTLGSKFEIETDHKPLVPLLSSKHLNDLPLRELRFRLRMAKFEYNISHMLGKLLYVADTLFRDPVPHQDSDSQQEEVEAFVNSVTTMSSLQQRSNWKLTLSPRSRKCEKRTSSAVWWPGVMQQITQLVQNCEVCFKESKPGKEPLISTVLPMFPWQVVGTNLFELNKDNYLLVVDYFSRYPEVVKLTSTTSASIISVLKRIFSRHGIPEIVRSDNGPQYASAEFLTVASSYGFQHITSSPKFPQSNGQAERCVQTIKNLLKKSNDPCLPLLSYHSTPLSWCDLSPAELCMGRRLRTSLPQTNKLLTPQWPFLTKFREQDKVLKEKQKKNFDTRHRVKELTPIPDDIKVWIMSEDRPVQGRVVSPAD